jgi:WD40 repeat protein
MAKNPDDRFQTVREMMDALDEAVEAAQRESPVESVLAELPVSLPGPVPAGTTVPKRTKPKWVWAAVGAAALSLLCLVTIVVVVRFLPFRVQVKEGQVEVVRRVGTTPTVMWSSTPQDTEGSLAQTTVTPSRPVSTATSEPTNSPTTASQTTPTATAATQPTPTHTPASQLKPIAWSDAFVQVEILDKGGYQAAFSPDGKLLAVSGHDLTLYDTQSWQQVRTLGQDGAFGFAFSPDGQTLAAIMGEVKLFDVNTGAEQLALPGFEIHTTAASGHFLAFSPDGQTLAVVVDEVVKLFDVQNGNETGIILAQGPSAIDLSPDGKLLASAGWSSGVALWDVVSGERVRTFGDRMLGAQRAVFTPDGSRLVTSGTGREAEATLWDVDSGRVLGTFDGHTDTINDLAFSPDERLLATVSRDITIRIWDVASGRELQMVTGHSREAQSIAFSPNGEMLASTSWDGTTRIWALVPEGAASPSGSTSGPTGPTMTPVPLAASAISPENASQVGQARSLEQGGDEVVWSPDGRLLAISKMDLMLYDTQTWQQVRVIGRGGTDGVVFSPDGRTLAAIMGEVKLFDATTGAELHTLSRTQISTSSASGYLLSFSPNGRTLAVIVNDIVKLIDVESGQETGLIIAPGAVAIAFSPDGQILASGAWDGLRLWDVTTGQQARVLGDRSVSSHRLAFSPDGSMLVSSGTGDEPIRFWDVESGRELRNWLGHTDTIKSLTFSPDGQLLVTASSDVTIKVWDVATGQELQTLIGHTGEVTSVAFSPDGATLASTTWDGPTLLWQVVPPSS